MDPDTEVVFDYPSLFRIYKSGRIERFSGTDVVPASVDPATGVTSKDVIINPDTGISARLYLPNKKHISKKLSVLVYFHGGAFCIQSAFSPTYQPYLNSLASQANLLAVSVNYRLATEHLLPTAYDDSWAALKWVLESRYSDAWLAEHGDFERVFIAGDSAGGNIAHQMVMRAGEEGVKIEGMVLVHPFFWGREAVGKETTETARIELLWRLVNLPGVDIDDPRINPIAKGAPSLAGLGCKRAMVCVAEKDVLAERGRAYYEALKGWTGAAELVVSQGEDHCFHLEQPQCEEALKLMARLVAFFIPMKAQRKINPKSGFSASTEGSIHITIGTSRVLQTTLKNPWGRRNPAYAEYNCLHLLNGSQGANEDNKMEKLGEAQDDLEMNKEEIHEALWIIGRQRTASCVIGFLLGALISLFFVMFKVM